MENVNNIEYIDNLKEFENHYLINDSLHVPKDSNNRHYKDIQQYIEEGGEVTLIEV